MPTMIMMSTHGASTISGGRSTIKTRQKDPSKSPSVDQPVWAKLNACLPKAVEQVIRPKILEMDADSCERIIKSMNYDKDLNNLQKQFLLKTRDEARLKLKDRR